MAMGVPEHILVDLKSLVVGFLKKIDFFLENLMVVMSDGKFGPCYLCKPYLGSKIF